MLAEVSAFVTAIRRIMPWTLVREQPTVSLWTSNLDGSGMTEVGHKPALPEPNDGAEVADILWVPGDREISFQFNDALYTVPVP